MIKERKKRLNSREAKRLRTLRQNKGMKAIREDARRAGSMATTHFTSESGKKANEIRWARYRAAKAKEQAEKGE